MKSTIIQRLLYSGVVLFSLSGWTQSQLQSTNTAATEVDISEVHIPMLQGSTSDTEINLNALVSRLVEPRFELYLPGQNQAVAIGQIVETIKPLDGMLHQKALKVRFTGLQANQEYTLKVFKGTGTSIIDERTTRTFESKESQAAPTVKPVKAIATSCFCDEDKFSEVKKISITKMLQENPDLLIFMGDQTYIDSFDFVERGKATTYDVWQRVFRSFAFNPITRSKKLIPAIVTWDDHDTGIDNGDKNTPTIDEARKAFQALYGSYDIPGVVENGKGVQRILSYRGVTFVMMDNRSYRDNSASQDRYGHFGQEQEEWVLRRIKELGQPVVLASGDLWSQEAVYKNNPDGTVKKISDGMFSDHPVQFQNFKMKLAQTQLPVVFLSGDVHFSEVTAMGPEWKGTSREFPYATSEITASPAYSILMFPRDGEPAFWKNPQRLTSFRDYGFASITFNSKQGENNQPKLSYSVDGISVQGLQYRYAQQVEISSSYKSLRRNFLNPKFIKAKKEVKVAFFDADDTLRFAPSGSVTANAENDVFILPRVAEKMKELKKKGYFIAIVSNQSGVSLGKVSFEVADKALRTTIQKIQENDPSLKIDYYDFAENSKEDIFAKPNVGMATYLENLLKQNGIQINWNESLMVGDAQYTKNEISPRGVRGSDFSNTDRLFAERLGIKSIHPRDLFQWSSIEEVMIKARDVSGLRKPICGKFYR